MSLDSARDASLGTAPEHASELSQRVHRRYRAGWLAVTLVVAVLNALMPSLHRWTFGEDRIVASIVQGVEATVHARLDANAQESMRSVYRARSSGVWTVTPLATTLLAVVINGMLLNVAMLLAGADLSPRRCLEISGVGALGATVVHITSWAFVVGFLGLERSVAADWLHVAPLTLGALTDVASHHPVFEIILSGIDFARLFGAGIAAVLLYEASPTTGWSVAISASLLWSLLILALTTVIAIAIGTAVY